MTLTFVFKFGFSLMSFTHYVFEMLHYYDFNLWTPWLILFTDFDDTNPPLSFQLGFHL